MSNKEMKQYSFVPKGYESDIDSFPTGYVPNTEFLNIDSMPYQTLPRQPLPIDTAKTLPRTPFVLTPLLAESPYQSNTTIGENEIRQDFSPVGTPDRSVGGFLGINEGFSHDIDIQLISNAQLHDQFESYITPRNSNDFDGRCVLDDSNIQIQKNDLHSSTKEQTLDFLHTSPQSLGGVIPLNLNCEKEEENDDDLDLKINNIESFENVQTNITIPDLNNSKQLIIDKTEENNRGLIVTEKVGVVSQGSVEYFITPSVNVTPKPTKLEIDSSTPVVLYQNSEYSKELGSPVEPSVVSDFSDSGSLHSYSSTILQTLSIDERMRFFLNKCKQLNRPSESFNGAQFIIQNAQYTEKADQVYYCEQGLKTLKKLSNPSVFYLDACLALAHLYVRGIPGFQQGHKPDYGKAFQLYYSIARKENTEASFHLSLCYEHGLGTQPSNTRAFQWYRKCAMSNHPGAMFRLGVALLRGELGQPKNPRDGLKWLKLATKYANEQYPQPLYELALLHEDGLKSLVWPDHGYMIELLTRAADLQHGPSQFKLGNAYEYGSYGVEKSPAKSIYYYSVAASNGHVKAMFELGGWYLIGTSDDTASFTLPQNDDEAVKWVLRAAERGLPKAMYAMGYFYEMGVGVDMDLGLGLEWYKKAAGAGDEKAVAKLVELERGLGGEDEDVGFMVGVKGVGSVARRKKKVDDEKAKKGKKKGGKCIII